jgi:hypothetical protein
VGLGVGLGVGAGVWAGLGVLAETATAVVRATTASGVGEGDGKGLDVARTTMWSGRACPSAPWSRTASGTTTSPSLASGADTAIVEAITDNRKNIRIGF